MEGNCAVSYMPASFSIIMTRASFWCLVRVSKCLRNHVRSDLYPRKTVPLQLCHKSRTLLQCWDASCLCKGCVEDVENVTLSHVIQSAFPGARRHVFWCATCVNGEGINIWHVFSWWKQILWIMVLDCPVEFGWARMLKKQVSTGEDFSDCSLVGLIPKAVHNHSE